MTEITFTDAAVDDLRRIGPDAAPGVLRKLRVLFDNTEAGYPLGGDLTGYRKLAVGQNTWRVVYRVTDDRAVEICEIWAIGARADAQVYAQAVARVRQAQDQDPRFHRLAKVLERLGRLSHQLDTVAPTDRQPVPDWLANRLIHTVGMTRQDVAALGLEEAVDRWTEFTLRTRTETTSEQ